MGRIPDEIIQKIRDHTDVVELVGRSVSLKRAGRSHKGLCPFHDEKSASFNVNPDRQTFYCFGCHEGGDVFSFLMKTENLTFVEAARSLARDAGIEVPESGGGGADRGISEQLFAANATMLECFRRELTDDGPGRAYLAGRGLDEEDAERFEVGFAPDVWDTAVKALSAARIPTEIGEQAGLLQRRERGGHYDRLRGRVIFPIRDVRGRVIGFGGRAIGADQQPKYLNTPETPIYRKREALYGFPKALDPIRRSERAVVVEGYFDQIAMCRAGIGEALATCGTALTPDHARSLRRRTQKVVLLFDGDGAGERAMLRALEALLPAGLRIHAALLPSGDDPDSLLLREGPEALKSLVDDAPSALEVAIERAVAVGHETPEAKADAVENVAPLLALVPSAIERSGYCNRLALAVGTEVRHVEAAVVRAARGEDPRDAIPIAPRRTGPEERNLRQLARSLVEHPALAIRVPHEELPALVSGGPVAELVRCLMEAAAEDRGVAFAELETRLSDEACDLLRALAIVDYPSDEAAAAQTVEDTIRWFRDHDLKRREQAITRQLRDPSAGDEEKRRLLDERQQLLQRKRQLAVTGTVIQPPPGPPS